MSFKEYMKYSCQQMYYERIFNKLYCIYNASENKTDNIWDKIIRELSNIVIDEQDRLISFDNLLKKSDIEMIEEIDKRITFLIELRGRFIIYLLKKHHFTTLYNVYPMSRTFSFLFSKYLDTKFYGIPGFIQ